jgi:hypothetical protein
MPYLKMYLCGKLLSMYEIDYTGMLTIQEKEQHQRNIADSMYQENIKNINLVQQEPFFCIDILSKSD